MIFSRDAVSSLSASNARISMKKMAPVFVAKLSIKNYAQLILNCTKFWRIFRRNYHPSVIDVNNLQHYHARIAKWYFVWAVTMKYMVELVLQDIKDNHTFNTNHRKKISKNSRKNNRYAKYINKWLILFVNVEWCCVEFVWKIIKNYVRKRLKQNP